MSKKKSTIFNEVKVANEELKKAEYKLSMCRMSCTERYDILQEAKARVQAAELLYQDSEYALHKAEQEVAACQLPVSNS